jgi:Flp pilus assembly pilin Flp
VRKIKPVAFAKEEAFMNKLKSLLMEEEGMGAEYALLVAFIAAVIIAGATALGTTINSRLSNTATTIGTGG